MDNFCLKCMNYYPISDFLSLKTGNLNKRCRFCLKSDLPLETESILFIKIDDLDDFFGWTLRRSEKSSPSFFLMLYAWRRRLSIAMDWILGRTTNWCCWQIQLLCLANIRNARLRQLYEHDQVTVFEYIWFLSLIIHMFFYSPLVVAIKNPFTLILICKRFTLDMVSS